MVCSAYAEVKVKEVKVSCMLNTEDWLWFKGVCGVVSTKFPKYSILDPAVFSRGDIESISLEWGVRHSYKSKAFYEYIKLRNSSAVTASVIRAVSGIINSKLRRTHPELFRETYNAINEQLKRSCFAPELQERVSLLTPSRRAALLLPLGSKERWRAVNELTMFFLIEELMRLKSGVLDE